MESKQDYKTARIIFLKKFTEEIIFNLSEEYESKRRINVEKLKQKFLSQEIQQTEDFNKIVNHKILQPVKYKKSEEKPNLTEKIKEKLSFITNILPHKTLAQKTPQEQQLLPLSIETPQQEVVQSIKPEYQPKPQELFLGKIEPILQDPLIQSIECPGPGKNILVNKYGKINVTKVMLAREEINEIITNFSNLSQIPLLDGILKAAVGNLMISAVTSDIVGSRFILNRINPAVNI